MIGSITSIARLIGIARTFARHDALFPLERMGVTPVIVSVAKLVSRRAAPGRPGERLAAALEELGPTFIKLGQALSVRPDLVGDAIADDLSALQDRLPPFPGATAREIIEQELETPVGELYRHFDETPVAAASIAQVHFAETPDGDMVAVKILRPGIEARFRQDIDLFLWLSRLLERTRPALRRLRPLEVVRTFEASVNIEMDLRLEAAAASELGENSEHDNGFRVPKIDWVRTGRRVMTLERIEGVRIDDLAALAEAGFEPRDILRRSAESFFNQVFRDGFFHADIHPGNMFVAPDGTLCPVDFGIMGRLDRKTRNYLADMLIGFLDRDYKRVAEVHFEAGYVPARKSVGAFTQAVRSIGEPILGKPLHEISLARLLAQLFQVTETFEMETQPQLLLLQKTMLVAEGVGRTLDPSINMWMLARPLIEEWVIANRGPEARLRDMVGDTVSKLERLPQLLGRAEAVAEALSGNERLSSGYRHESESSPGFFGSNSILYVLIAVIAVLLIANL
ncbi:MAG: 2-polyprenylphenol 6-hydroxylase [Alphaproteobacteria bacterium]|nr:2-polyprenylphenol 6-hydroxylase [Alphaproteobacteria bacterium]